MKPTKGNCKLRDNIKFAICFPCIVLAMSLVYVFLHEAGHSIVAIACGARISQFSIANAHMTYAGGHFTPATDSLRNASGMLLPVGVFTLALLFFNKNNGKIIYRCCYFAACIWGIGPVLAWIIVPVICMVSTPPAGDDVAKFIVNSGWHPGIVTTLACALIAIVLFYTFIRGIPQSFKEMIKSFRV